MVLLRGRAIDRAACKHAGLAAGSRAVRERRGARLPLLGCPSLRLLNKQSRMTFLMVASAASCPFKVAAALCCARPAAQKLGGPPRRSSLLQQSSRITKNLRTLRSRAPTTPFSRGASGLHASGLETCPAPLHEPTNACWVAGRRATMPPTVFTTTASHELLSELGSCNALQLMDAEAQASRARAPAAAAGPSAFR